MFNVGTQLCCTPSVTPPGSLAAELLFHCSFCLYSQGWCGRTEGSLDKGVLESSTESLALLFTSEGLGGILKHELLQNL